MSISFFYYFFIVMQQKADVVMMYNLLKSRSFCLSNSEIMII